MKPDERKQVIFNRSDLKAMGVRASNTSLLRWEALGRFPRRIRMAGTSVGWLANEIAAWVEARAAERSRHSYAEY